MVNINSNSMALKLNLSLQQSTDAMFVAMERMSTGYKINSAKDNAAGYAIVSNLEKTIKGYIVAQGNIQNGINLLNVASGASSNMQKLLQRMQDLCLMAANDTYSKEQKGILETEANALLDEFYRLKKTTQFNGLYLFEPKNKSYAINTASAIKSINTSISYSPVMGKTTTSETSNNGLLIKSDLNNLTTNNNVAESTHFIPNILDLGDCHPPPEEEIAIEYAYEPKSSMTGSDMQALKHWIDAGESYDDFEIALSNGMSAQEILDSKKISTKAPIMATMAVITNGTIDFSSSQTQVVTIDGLTYTVKNLRTSANSIVYSKEDSGQLTLTGADFDITLQSDAKNDVLFIGGTSVIRAGNQGDKVTVDLNGGRSTHVYGGTGDDEVSYIRGGQTSIVYFNKGGNNTYSLNGATGTTPAVNGGSGTDTINLGSNVSSFTYNGTTGRVIANINTAYTVNINGGAGDNIFNVNANTANGHVLSGQNGNDTFNLNATGIQNTKCIGGGGNNTLYNNGNVNNIATNITTATGKSYTQGYDIQFNAKQEKTLTLVDGNSYTITNNKNVSDFLVYSIDATGRLNFIYQENAPSTTNYYTVKANQASKFGWGLTYGQIYGSDFDDDISITGGTNKLWAGGGNDTISMTGSGILAYLEKGNNTVTVAGSYSVLYGGIGDDIFHINSASSTAYGNAGNNTFNMNVNNAFASGGSGNDKFVIKSGITGATAMGGGGVNTVEGNIAGARFLTDMSNAINNAYSIELPANGTDITTVNINGANYDITNNLVNGHTSGYVPRMIAYSVDINDKVSFVGSQVSIAAQKDKYHDIEIFGATMVFKGGDTGNKISWGSTSGTLSGGLGDDIITFNAGSSGVINGVAGNNTFIVNAVANLTTGNGNNKIVMNITGSPLTAGTGNNHYIINKDNIVLANGGNGNNTYEINANNCSVTAGSGNDTFIVNGNNNSTLGGAGDDYFIIASGNANTVVGGSGTNYLVNHGTGTLTPLNDVTIDPHSGMLYFNDNTTPQSITLYGKTYTITNKTTEGALLPTNTLNYNYNQLTGEVSFIGSNFTIAANDGNDHNIILRGNNNVLNGGNGNDKITIATGTNNKIDGGAGNDTITANTTNNKLVAGIGNDIINVNADSNFIDGVSGNNTININSNQNTIQGGSSKENIFVNGSENIIDAGTGDDYVSITGDKNTINSSQGNNSFTIKGNQNNLIETGNTNNTIAVDGEQNNTNIGNGKNNVTLVTSAANTFGNTLLTGDGDNNITISGNKNDVQTGDGKNTVNINGASNDVKTGQNDDIINIKFGAGNKVDSGNGNNNVIISSSNNDLTTGSGEDKIVVNGFNNLVNSGEGSDNLTINGNSNNINSGNGNNTVNVNSDNNTIIGGNDIDIFNVSGNGNNIESRAGNDNLIVNGNSNTLSSTSGLNDFTIRGDYNNVQGGSDSDKIAVNGKENKAYGGDGDDEFDVKLYSQNTYIDGENGDNTMINRGTNTTALNVKDITPDPLVIRLQVGTDSSDSSAISVTTTLDIEDLFINFSTLQKTLETLEALRRTMNTIIEKNAQYGATTNRLTSAAEIAKISEMNLTAAKSNIMDADIAAESSAFIKNQILQKASSMLFM